MRSPLIIVTGAHIYTPEGYPQNLLWQVYMDGIIIGRGLPVLATDVPDESAARQLAELADGLFLSGGVDVTPSLYGEEKIPQCGNSDPKRDKIERLLLDAFISVKKPVLGICRGFQMLNVYFGGTLYQDILSQTGLSDHPYDCFHSVRTVEGSIVRSLFGSEFVVNSLHHQAVKNLADDLVATAYSVSGNIIESYEHKHLPIIGVQWHPERMTGTERMSPLGPDMAPYLEYFVNMCR